MHSSFSKNPILETLENYLSKKPVRMHVPFHNGIPNNNIFPKELYNLDISEVSGYDIDSKDNPIFQSEKITANYFGVEHSFYLTGGASVGLAASMIALNKFGRKIIIARNVHKSVINGIVLSGLEPIWLDIDFLDEWGIFGKVNPDKLEKSISNLSDIAGCVIVSPTYEGVISNVKEISALCHKKNIPLIVDEAHGGHLHFCRELSRQFPTLTYGDLTIQSWHKSLGSLTQSGVLHLANERFFTYNDIKRSLDLISSTSPSFLLLLSLELTRKYLAETSGSYFNSLLTIAKSLKKEMQEIVKACHGVSLQIFNNDDSFKIYLKSKNISGIDFAYELYKKYSIEIESANDIGLLMLIGQEFNNDLKNRIIDAVKEIVTRRDAINRVSTMVIKSNPKTKNFKSNPRNAFMQGFKNKTNYKYESEINAPCPPGYAINVPGMKKGKS